MYIYTEINQLWKTKLLILSISFLTAINISSVVTYIYVYIYIYMYIYIFYIYIYVYICFVQAFAKYPQELANYEPTFSV